MSKNKEIEVQKKLPDRFGLKPGVYLTIYYFLIALAIFLVFAFLPSFCSNTALVTFNKDTVPMAIYNDETYIGSTLNDINLKKGTYNFTFKVLDEKVSSLKVDIKPRRFFSYIRKTKYDLNYPISLDKNLQEKLINYMIDTTLKQSYITDFGKNRYYQPIIKQVTSTFLVSNSSKEMLLNSFKKIICLISSEKMKEDLLSSYSLLNEKQPDINIKTTNSFIPKFNANEKVVLITKKDFTKFLFNNYSFSRGVVKPNIADSFYLSNFEELKDDDLITAISYNIANEYAKYLSKKNNKIYKVATLNDLENTLSFLNLNIATSTNYANHIDLILDNNLDYAKAVVNYNSKKVGMLKKNECSLTTTYVLKEE